MSSIVVLSFIVGTLRDASELRQLGLSPDPDKVFNESIRALEEVACPLVEQRKAAKGVATLSTVTAS